MPVYLVGAGPGDPRLLTVRAEEVLARADVVVYDRLVDWRVLNSARDGAELIDVGKHVGEDPDAQEAINALLIERARAGLAVVRLKGGDPYVFGRGGEEALELEAAGVEYEVVPGVSSIAAVPAYAGVPLTMRGVSSIVTVVTGHDASAPDSNIDWGRLGGPSQTLVVLMGVAQRSEIAMRLLGAGRAPDTPVLVVERGTTATQRSQRAVLADLGRLAVESPATIVIGEVAAIELASFEQRPLFGWPVVVTRAPGQSGDLLSRLAEVGAEVIEFPTIEIAPPRDGGAALAGAAARVGSYDWVVFASQNAVHALFAHLEDGRALAGAKAGAIGAETAASLRRVGVVADLVATGSGTESLLSLFPPPKDRGTVLLPRSSLADERLPDALRELGWDVEVVEAYDTRPATTSPRAIEVLGRARAITFTSASTVRGFLHGAGAGHVPPVVCSIGPSTSAAIRDAGLDVAVEAERHTAAGLVEALLDYAGSAGPASSPLPPAS